MRLRLNDLHPAIQDLTQMTDFQVAHIREQGQDLIIVFVSDSFGRAPDAEKRATTMALQQCARAAGLAGAVVPVWDNGGGRMGFGAHQNFHPFFQSISLDVVAASINKKLTCG
jgi:hypothetical protein